MTKWTVGEFERCFFKNKLTIYDRIERNKSINEIA